MYRMPVEVMRVGMICAAQYIHLSSSDWHRCLITGFSDGFVQVRRYLLFISYQIDIISLKNTNILYRLMQWTFTGINKVSYWTVDVYEPLVASS